MNEIGIPKGSLFSSILCILKKIFPNVPDEIGEMTKLVLSVFWLAKILRPQDMPKYVYRRDLMCAICGYDCVAEARLVNKVKIVCELPISKKTRDASRICLITRESNQQDLPSAGLDIPADWPNIAEDFFQGLNLKVRIDPVEGAVETLISDRYPYGVTVVETGKSLKTNNLRIAQTILTSPTVLIANLDDWQVPEKRQEIENISRLIQGVLHADRKLVKANVPDGNIQEVGDFLTPFAIQGSTVNPIWGKMFHAVEIAVNFIDLYQVVSTLNRMGCSGIIVSDINILIP